MKFYSVQIRETIEVPNSEVEVITMKNGKKAVQAVVEKNGKELKLFKIISNEELAMLKGN